jgi:hypothetical protein
MVVARMTDRQKLAETVREALQLSLSLTGITVSGYSHEDYDRSMDALDVLAQPCQECKTLRENLAEAEEALGDLMQYAETMPGYSHHPMTSRARALAATEAPEQ